MEKFTIKTTVSKEVEKEVGLPFFCKNGGLFMKVLSKSETIAVNDYSFCTGIEVADTGRFSGIMVDAVPCTEEEFNASFEKAMNVFSNLQTVVI